MVLAFDNVRKVIYGPREMRIEALFTLLIWFAASGFVISAAGEYIAVLEGTLINIFGATVVAALAFIVKVSS